jgi:hypothetical protein
VKKQRYDANSQLRNSVPQQGPCTTLREAPTKQTSQSESGHEAAEDDRNAVHVASEEETEAAHPEHLVDEARGTGEQENSRNEQEDYWVRGTETLTIGLAGVACIH